VGGTNVPQPQSFSTNGQWSQQAESDLVASGAYQAGDVLQALGKFLAKQPLTPSEATIVQAAEAIEGAPPVGGPWSLIAQTSPPPNNGGGGKANWNWLAPGNLHMSNIGSTTANVNWNAVNGNGGTHPSGYEVDVYQTNGKRISSRQTSSTEQTLTGLHPGWSYHVVVYATGGPGGNPYKSNTQFTTKK
jgi:hypothetical protein